MGGGGLPHVLGVCTHVLVTKHGPEGLAAPMRVPCLQTARHGAWEQLPHAPRSRRLPGKLRFLRDAKVEEKLLGEKRKQKRDCD